MSLYFNCVSYKQCKVWSYFVNMIWSFLPFNWHSGNLYLIRLLIWFNLGLSSCYLFSIYLNFSFSLFLLFSLLLDWVFYIILFYLLGWLISYNSCFTILVFALGFIVYIFNPSILSVILYQFIKMNLKFHLFPSASVIYFIYI